MQPYCLKGSNEGVSTSSASIWGEHADGKKQKVLPDYFKWLLNVQETWVYFVVAKEQKVAIMVAQ